MPQSLDDLSRQVLFIVKDAPSTRGLTLPGDWQVTSAAVEVEVVGSLEVAREKSRRALIVIGEEDFLRVRQAISERGSLDTYRKFGIVVLTNNESQFLPEHGLAPDVIDVFAHKDFRDNPEFHLVRALVHLIRHEEKGHPKLGYKTLEHLNHIFIALSAERNPQKLLTTIVTKAIELTSGEGGTLYMVQEIDGELYFRQRITSNAEGNAVSEEMHTRVVENSICGYVALTGKILNIPDVSKLRPLTLPQFHRSVDYNVGEETKSLLTISMRNSRNEIIAVLQLVNKKSDPSEPDATFPLEDESLLSSFAAQAAICLENVDLYADIQRLFEGFVKASISAIESRDPSTGGHSERVAKMSVSLARATTECGVGIYRSVRFREEEIRELEYAAMLHDFGKIGVREEVLVKAKKLYPYQLDAIKDRIKICKAAAKIAHLEKRLKSEGANPDWEKEYEQRLHEIDSYWSIVLAINEPTVLKKENIEALERIRSEQLLLPDGSMIGVLAEEEYHALSVTRGSLTDNERLEIESHVRHTHQFLKMIPWTKDFRHLTEIAYCHHEKLDGSGYPRGLSSHEIPLQSKIMTIADIFDALTAADRWYKEAVPMEKALDILRQEVTQGKIDPVLFDIFVEKRIFEVTLPREVSKVA